MDFKKCNRCGCFYVANGDVCPKCNSKENFEISTFKNYLKENGFNGSITDVSNQTGIPAKHLNRFLGYEEFKQYSSKNFSDIESNNSKSEIVNKIKADLS